MVLRALGLVARSCWSVVLLWPWTLQGSPALEGGLPQRIFCALRACAQLIYGLFISCATASAVDVCGPVGELCCFNMRRLATCIPRGAFLSLWSVVLSSRLLCELADGPTGATACAPLLRVRSAQLHFVREMHEACERAVHFARCALAPLVLLPHHLHFDTLREGDFPGPVQ